jgi:hypothetical protein
LKELQTESAFFMRTLHKKGRNFLSLDDEEFLNGVDSDDEGLVDVLAYQELDSIIMSDVAGKQRPTDENDEIDDEMRRLEAAEDNL